MQIIDLIQSPNFEFTTTLENAKYDIAVRTVGDLTYMTISRNAVKLIDSVRCVPFEPILPYEYLEEGGGNFAFDTKNDEYPNYTQFNVSHIFLYATAAEIAAARASAA